jgi:hypothetical protein
VRGSAFVAGLVAVALLLTSLAFFAYAQVVTKEPPKDGARAKPLTPDERALKAVRDRTRDGTIIGAIALASLGAMVLAVGLQRDDTETRLFAIDETSLARVHQMCPVLQTPFRGKVPAALIDTAKSFAIQISAKHCIGKTGRSVTLLFSRGEIVGWTSDAD